MVCRNLSHHTFSQFSFSKDAVENAWSHINLKMATMETVWDCEDQT